MSATTSTNSTRELGSSLVRWARTGVGVVRVLGRHGFGTVEPGQLLVAGSGGDTAGQVYLGALDAVALPLAREARAGAATRDAHAPEADAVEAGLACGGGATLLGHPLSSVLAEALGTELAEGRPAALVSTSDGTHQLVLTGPDLAGAHGGLGSTEADEAAAEAARRLLRRGVTHTERLTGLPGAADLLLDLWVPVPELLVVGSGAIGDALLAQAGVLGWGGRRVTGLDDARAALREFTDADVLVILDHAPKFDALLIEGVRAGRGFLGALGSRHTQSARRQRLTAAGLTEAEMALVHGPVGLDLGARTPAETAVSIVAEVIASRSGRSGAALAGGDGRIGT